MRVCDICNGPIILTRIDKDLEPLDLALQELGDFCNKCLRKFNSVIKGNSVIITKKEYEEFLNWKKIIENKREVSHEEIKTKG